MIAKIIDRHFRRQATPEVWEEVDALRAALRGALADAGCTEGALCPHWVEWHRVARDALRVASGIEAPSGGETGTGSTEGESPAPEGGDAHTLCLNMASAITLANRTLPHADRIDRLCVSCDTPLAADWCPNCEQVSETYRWPAGEPAFYEPGYNPERIEALLADETVERIAGQSCERRMVA